MAFNTSRRKLLEEILPEGVIVTRKWLMEEIGLDTHAIDNLVKSEQLKLLWKGIYSRGRQQPDWQSLVHTLQKVMKTDLVIGGLTALELKGFSHYLPQSKSHPTHLYGNDKLPGWVAALPGKTSFVKHTRKSVFAKMEDAVSAKYTTGIFWKEGQEELKIATPERACLEMLNEVPGNVSFEHADQLIQGMTSLSPRALQQLLEACTNVKVKRLFLWFAERHGYVWFTRLNTEKIDLGSGKRLIARNGVLDKTYLITVPQDFEE